METFLTVAQAAQLLQVHTETVRRMIRRGDLPYVRIGNVYRIDPADIRKQRNPKRALAPPNETRLSRYASREWRERNRNDDAAHRRGGSD